MNLHALDLSIVVGYLTLVALLGFWINRRATRGLDAYYLAGRNVPWWMLGLSGCSSYIDIGGTMAMVGALFYLGLKSVWMTHLWWGWFMICFYMAFQAKWIRRSGVMTFAEWNETRFGSGRDAEAARIAAALFLLTLMVCNLMYIAVGIGKFAEEVLQLERVAWQHVPLVQDVSSWLGSTRWLSTLLVFGAVGVYVTMGGFFGVILTDMLQTVLIAVGAVILAFLVFHEPSPAQHLAARSPEWGSLAPAWKLWPDYASGVPEAYRQFEYFGPILLAGFFWCIFRVLAGPNVWDFQFFLTARSPRDAALAGGLWTTGYTLRWILGCAFLVLGFHYLGVSAGKDAEGIMPLVLRKLPVGVQGLFLAVLLAALMSTLDAMINVTSSVVVNDFLKRYFVKRLSQKTLVKLGQLASIGALVLGFSFSLAFDTVISAWEIMIFVVVTMILVPSTFRWHWWRFSAKAFVLAMAGTAIFILTHKLFVVSRAPNEWPGYVSYPLYVGASLLISVAAGFLTRPADLDVLVRFYAKVRPFGFWGPVRREAVRRRLVPPRDPVPFYDALNGLLTAGFQVSLCLVPFYALLRMWSQALLWTCAVALLASILYFTWYRNLPPKEEGSSETL